VIFMFGTTALLGAVLVFSVQPLLAKMLLPYFGGAPAVWNAAMLFFQAGLLLGYLYAFALDRSSVRPKLQPWIHVALLAAGLPLLPVTIDAGILWESHPAAGVIATLAVVIGLPFAIISGTAPLLQAWFARIGHRYSSDPYFLYAASNVGSLTALLAYPFVLERFWPLNQLTLAWTVGYTALLAMVAIIAFRDRPAARPSVAPAAGRSKWQSRGPTREKRVALWLLLSFIPSALLHGVTIHISTDIAAAPLLWIIPLSLFLLTYILAFSTLGRRLERPVTMLTPLAFPLVFVSTLIPLTWALVGQLVSFFVLAMACHLRLYALRPEPGRLTVYYLALSLGGVLGGGFIALLAPVVFTGAYEYPLTLALAAIVLFWEMLPPTGRTRGHIFAAAAALGVSVLVAFAGTDQVSLTLAVTGIAVALVMFLFPISPRLVGALAGIALVTFFVQRDWRGAVWQDRSFFGVYRIVESDEAHLLMNGTTLHGGQLRNHDQPMAPIAYYTPEGPLGDIFAELRASAPLAPSIGVIGLGVGNALCYRQPGDHWRVVEIDPLVRDIALDARYFDYVESCGDGVEIEIGDGRRLLENDPGGKFDLLIIDAFSSDSIPIHLLTREAIAVYRDKLRPGGMLAFHISNRHIDLAPVMTALALDAGLDGRIAHDLEKAGKVERLPSIWVVMTADKAKVANFDPREGQEQRPRRWSALPATLTIQPWSDNFSDIVSVINW